MWRTRWMAGPAPESGRALVSITAFDADRVLDVPGIYLAGYRLSRGWSDCEGAVGLWLWGDVLGTKSGSVSVWQGEEALRRFVRSDAHRAIVRAYRGRGRLRTVSWWSEGFVRRDAWAVARRRLRTLWLPDGDSTPAHVRTR